MAYRSEFYLGDRNPHVDETEVSWMDPFKETFDDSVTKGVYDLGMRGLESLGDKYAQDYAGAKSLLGDVGSSVSDAAKDLILSHNAERVFALELAPWAE